MDWITRASAINPLTIEKNQKNGFDRNKENTFARTKEKVVNESPGSQIQIPSIRISNLDAMIIINDGLISASNWILKMEVGRRERAHRRRYRGEREKRGRRFGFGGLVVEVVGPFGRKKRRGV